MERKRFEELIIDYIEGTLTRQEEEELLSALTENEEYREIYDQYVSIRNVIGKEDDISPSEEILNSISEYARHSARKENPSILKQWFKFPVLAPLLGAAIVALFWFSVGEEYLKDKNIIKVEHAGKDQDLLANYQVRRNEDKQASEVVVAEEQIVDIEINKLESEEADELDEIAATPSAASDVEDVGKSAGYRDDKTNLQTELQEASSGKKGKSSLAGSTKTPESEGTAGFAVDQSKDDLQAEMEVASEPKPVLKEAVDDRTEKRSLKRESVGAQVATVKPENAPVPEQKSGDGGEYFRERINDVLAQQYKGDCLTSIKTSNEILNSKPEPPKAVKTTLYLSQAECYEELNQIDNAIKAYEKVQTIEPSSSSFFSTKIRQLNLKKVK